MKLRPFVEVGHRAERLQGVTDLVLDRPPRLQRLLARQQKRTDQLRIQLGDTRLPVPFHALKVSRTACVIAIVLVAVHREDAMRAATIEGDDRQPKLAELRAGGVFGRSVGDRSKHALERNPARIIDNAHSRLLQRDIQADIGLLCGPPHSSSWDDLLAEPIEWSGGQSAVLLTRPATNHPISREWAETRPAGLGQAGQPWPAK